MQYLKGFQGTALANSRHWRKSGRFWGDDRLDESLAGQLQATLDLDSSIYVVCGAVGRASVRQHAMRGLHGPAIRFDLESTPAQHGISYSPSAPGRPRRNAKSLVALSEHEPRWQREHTPRLTS
jgi:hypothetical protein